MAADGMKMAFVSELPESDIHSDAPIRDLVAEELAKASEKMVARPGASPHYPTPKPSELDLSDLQKASMTVELAIRGFLLERYGGQHRDPDKNKKLCHAVTMALARAAIVMGHGFAGPFGVDLVQKEVRKYRLRKR